MIVPWFALGLWFSLWASQTLNLFWIGLVLVALSTTVTLLTARRGLKARLFMVFAMIVLVCFSNWAGLQQSTQRLESLAQDFTVQKLEVRVSSCVTSRCQVSTQIQGINFHAQLIDPSTGDHTSMVEPLKPGMRLGGSFLFKPSNYRDDDFVLTPQGTLQVIDVQPSWTEELRTKFSRSLSAINTDAGALVMGLSIGDDSKLSQSAKDRMKTLSLTHLTAVSGANCAIVIGAVMFLLRRMGSRRWLIGLVASMSLWSYVAIVGEEPSVLRSALMAGLVIALTFLGRKTPPTVALGWAVIGLLIAWPKMASSLGFALSVTATAAILLLAPKIYQRLSAKLPNTLAASLSVVMAAQLWCLPVLLPISSGIPTYSIIANLLAEPLVAPVTVLGMASLVFCPVFPALSSVLTLVASLLTNLILVITGLALFGGSTIQIPGGLFGLTMVVFAVVTTSWWLLKKARVALALTGATLLMFIATSSASSAQQSTWPLADWQLVACNVGQGDGLVFRSTNAIAVIDVGREPEPIRRCLDRLGVKHIQLLVLTHYDADHVGGLEGALEGRTIGTAFLTPMVDDRPLASRSQDLLERAKVHVEKVSCCLSGALGAATWQVLQPEIGALGSEDSNDASIVMRFDTSELSFFSFADLGERGQMRLVMNHPELVVRDSSKFSVVKVSHHGSADQYPELMESLKADLALFSVGERNPYGHPTLRTLKLFNTTGSAEYRTDISGSIAVSIRSHELLVAVSGDG